MLEEAADRGQLGDVGVDQPQPALFGRGVDLGDGRLAGAQRLDLGAGQHDAGLDRRRRSNNRTAPAGSRRRSCGRRRSWPP